MNKTWMTISKKIKLLRKKQSQNKELQNCHQVFITTHPLWIHGSCPQNLQTCMSSWPWDCWTLPALWCALHNDVLGFAATAWASPVVPALLALQSTAGLWKVIPSLHTLHHHPEKGPGLQWFDNKWPKTSSTQVSAWASQHKGLNTPANTCLSFDCTT